MKRILAILCAVACLLLTTAGAVSAASPSLTVVMKYGKTPLQGICLAVCRVDGAGESFARLSAEENTAQAAAFHARAVENNTERIEKTTDSEGKAVFEGLPDGLYLVVQVDGEADEYIVAPYMVVLPRDAVSLPKSEPVKREPPTTAAAPSASANEGGPDYALPGTGEPDADASKPGRFTLPKTDDLNNLALWLVIMGGSCAGFVTVVLLARKRKRREKNPA